MSYQIGHCAYCGPECDMCQSARKLDEQGRMELRVTRDKVTGAQVLRCHNWRCYLRTVDSLPVEPQKKPTKAEEQQETPVVSVRDAWGTGERKAS